MISAWSPGRSRRASSAASASTSPLAWPRSPSARTTAPASQPRSAGAYSHTSSAPASDGASVSRCTPSFMVFERGSSTATMRAAPTRRRRPSIVVAIAVGWCAKSSYTRTPRTSPRSSMRRLMPRNSPSALQATSAGTPAWRAAAIAASALSTLWPPSSAQLHASDRPPESSTSNSEPSSAPGASRALHCAPPPPSRAKPSRGVQQPIASVAASCGSAALQTRRPGARHGAHQVVELALDRGEVGIDVGVVEFEVVEDRGARPVVHELGALVEERGVVLVGLDHEERDSRRGAR